MKLEMAIKPLALAVLLVPFLTQAAPSRDELDVRLKTAESRLQRLEGATSTEVVLELLEKVEQLQQENAQLQGRLEEQVNELEKLRKRQRDLYLDIDRRINEIQLTAPPAVAVDVDVQAEESGEAEVPAQAAPEAVAAPVVAVDPAQERSDYESAFNFLREGRHQDAIGAFKTFLKDYPGGRYAHNAQYWIGEAYYVTRNFDSALTEFQTVLDKYPNSNKDADARLKLGYTYYELKQWDQARKILASVVQKYPVSKAASLAEKRLLNMSKEKR